MTILQGDIKIMASQVLADVPEGGGAATGTEIVDGQSNNLFPDISELDRTLGRVNLRKVFPAVRTLNNDGYFGVNVIVSDAPDDAAVSAVLFSTGEYFDTRTEAQTRIESYLTRGPQYGGLLFGDHIEGMRTITILQRSSVAIPSIGTTLYLRANAGTANEVEQYVRITQVTSRDRDFAVPESTQADQTFRRTEVTVELSDPLRADYNGFQPVDSYRDSTVDYTNKTQLFETVVADAAQYYGIVPLAVAGAINDFSVDVESIFSQVVPSAQVETPIADARMNQQSAAIAPSGQTITQSLTLAFTTTQPMFVGGGIAPGTLSIARDGITVVDKSGKLQRDNQDVGTIDYENGILSLSTNVWSVGGTHAVTYQAAGSLTIVTRSIGVPVSQQSQSLSQVVSLTPIPAPASLQVSYLSGGRWYVLKESGTGAIAGSDTSLGAGTLNFSTGTVSITMGALPDIGSQVIYSWAPTQDRKTVSTADLANQARAYFELNLGPIEPGSLSLEWNDGQARTATDNLGALQGDASGTVYYGAGRVLFSPAAMPSPGTPLNYTITTATAHAESVAALTDNTATWTWTLPGGPIKPRSVRLAVAATIPTRQYPGSDVDVTSLYTLQDDGAGNLYVQHLTGTINVGTVNYTSGAVSITKANTGFVSSQGNWSKTVLTGDAGDGEVYIVFTGNSNRTTGFTIRGDFTGAQTTQPPWAWWTNYTNEGAFAQYAGTSGASTTGQVLLSTAYVTQLGTYASFAYGFLSWYFASFKIGGSTYQARSGQVVKDVNPINGEGEVVGFLLGGRASMSNWPAGASSLISTLAAGASPGLASSQDVLTDGVIFRTAQAPLKPSSFQVSGTLANGTTFSVSANSSGHIIGTYVKGKVDVETGVVILRFCQDTATPPDPLNPGAGKINLGYLGIPGVNWVDGLSVQADSLRYNAVAYSYIPLDADILGLDPVRLPSDGRVPIFRAGTVAVVHNTQTTSPATVTNSQTVDLGRTRLSRVRVIGNDGGTINTGYTADLNAGTVTFTNVTGYSQPVRIEHRIEDSALVSAAQITGRLNLTRAITHAYPVPGSWVSSALLIGDMQSRVSSVFDQGTWSGVWSDDLIGDQAGATYNTIDYPITCNNLGAVTERFALRFIGATAFQCIGEHLGVIGSGSTAADFAPINPATGQPYFTVLALGWGGGWATGNALRINTVGALAPVWAARVIQQSQPTDTADSFAILVRGDIDNPA
ncbi:MAG: hypothetical protein RL456_1121 [Pseudomonadota bacterium]|jgi:hypothetical protein